MRTFLHGFRFCRDAGAEGGIPPVTPPTTPPTDTPPPAPTTPPDAPPTVPPVVPPADDTSKTLTQAEVDRVVQQTIAKERKRAEAAIAAAKTEAEQVARMTAEQRAEHERQAQTDALAKREADIARREIRADALQTLATRGLPAELADTLSYTDAETCTASIDAVEKAYRAAVQKGVESRMKGTPPPATNPPDDGGDIQAKLKKAFGLK